MCEPVIGGILIRSIIHVHMQEFRYLIPKLPKYISKCSLVKKLIW